MDFDEAVDVVGRTIEAFGVTVIVLGVVASLARYAWGAVGPARSEGYGDVRRSIGRSILLGLELLVAGDIIRTVAVDPTFESVGVLAVIVAIRTFLSFTLEVEITSRWPWQGDSARRPSSGSQPA
ncbi:MAG TPA: DUF1622 domain-containing protein [Acidimicrobiales bacterium]